METQSVASFASVYGKESRDIPPTRTKAVVSESCQNAKKTDLSSIKTQKFKKAMLDFDRISIGLNCFSSSPIRTAASKT